MNIRLFILTALVITGFAPGSYAAKLQLSHVDSTFQRFERSSMANGVGFQKEENSFDNEIKVLAKSHNNFPFSYLWSSNLPFQVYSCVLISVSINPSAVPIPAAVWLFGSGILGLAGFKRKKV
ncbi:MAG: VPLPA-CTERM sorting domain-containing protein [Methyloglobulus sp.]